MIVYENDQVWRSIWTDGRDFPKITEPRWYGYSVGKWVDDTTLVVETVGMDQRTWIDNVGRPQYELECHWLKLNDKSISLLGSIPWKTIWLLLWRGHDFPQDRNTHCDQFPGLTGGGNPLAHQFGFFAPFAPGRRLAIRLHHFGDAFDSSRFGCRQITREADDNIPAKGGTRGHVHGCLYLLVDWCCASCICERLEHEV